MSEPTSVITFYDMLLRVAEKAGMAYYGSTGQGKPVVPVDAFNLDKCKRIVNDAFRLFDASPPPRGWKWKERIASILLAVTASGTATGGSPTTLVDSGRTEANDYFNDWIISVTGGTGKGETAIVTDYALSTGTFTFTALSGGSTPDTTSIYRVEKVNLMPEDFAGQVDGPITYSAATNHGSPIAWVDESTIRQLRANWITTGYPIRAAYVPYTPSAGSLGGRRWELKVDPAPVAADTLLFPYTSHFNEMKCETGVATGGTSATLVDSGRLEADDYFNGWILTVVDGTGLGQTATITDYTESSGTFAFTALSGGSTPDTTTVYYVEPASNLHPAGVKFDDCVMSACYAEAEKQIEEINEGAVELFYKVHLKFAHNLDSLSRPRRLVGKRGYGRRTRNRMRDRTWLNVTTDHDQ